MTGRHGTDPPTVPLDPGGPVSDEDRDQLARGLRAARLGVPAEGSSEISATHLSQGTIEDWRRVADVAVAWCQDVNVAPETVTDHSASKPALAAPKLVLPRRKVSVIPRHSRPDDKFFCEQCDQLVTAGYVSTCKDRFCKAKIVASPKLKPR